MAGAAVGGGVGDAHALEAAGVVGGDGLPLDLHGQLGVAEGLHEAGRALGGLVAQTLPVGDHLQELALALHVAELEPLLFGDVALLGGLHQGGDHVTRLDGVEAKGVAQVDGVAHPGAVGRAGVGSQAPGRLVLDRLEADRLAVEVDLDHLLAGHRAGVAGVVLDQDVLADGLAGDLARGLPAGVLGVEGGQRADGVGDVHQHVGAVDAQPSLARRGDVVLVHDRRQRPLVGLLPGRLVGGLIDALVAGYDHDGLELLRAPHRAGAAAARGALVVVEPGGELDQILARGTDGHHVGVLAVAFAQDLVRLVGGFAPEVGGVFDLDLTVLHQQVDRFFGRALDEQAVEAGPLELGRGPAAHVAVGHRTRERALGDHRQTAAHLGLGSGERAGHDREQVVGAERVHVGAVVEDVLDAEPTATDPLLQIFFLGGLVGDLTGGEVDLGQPVCISFEHGYLPFGRSRLRCVW